MMEEQEAERIHEAIDKIGNDIKGYLLASTDSIVKKSEAFLRKYGDKIENKYFFTEENITTLVISSINNGIGELGILCESHDAADPIRVTKRRNIVHRRLNKSAPLSPGKMTARQRAEYYFKPAENARSPEGRGKRARRELNFGPGGERQLTFSQNAGNGTRRKRR